MDKLNKALGIPFLIIGAFLLLICFFMYKTGGVPDLPPAMVITSIGLLNTFAFLLKKATKKPVLSDRL